MIHRNILVVSSAHTPSHITGTHICCDIIMTSQFVPREVSLRVLMILAA